VSAIWYSNMGLESNTALSARFSCNIYKFDNAVQYYSSVTSYLLARIVYLCLVLSNSIDSVRYHDSKSYHYRDSYVKFRSALTFLLSLKRMTCKGYIKGAYLRLPMQLIDKMYHCMQNNSLYDCKS